VALFAAEIGIEFSGVIGMGQEVRVALTNSSSGASQWLSIGDSYAGYRVASYDAKAETLVLTKDGKEFRLGLKQAKVQHGAGKPPPELEKAVLNNLRMLAAASDQYYLENGKTSTTYDELVGPTKYIKSITPADGENYRALVFRQGQEFKVTTKGGYTISYQP
jgi:hypothetical protein